MCVLPLRSLGMVFGCHQIISKFTTIGPFDVKMEDFECTAWIVARAHTMKDPVNLTYASIMSHETLYIALLITALNNIGIYGYTSDVLNTSITGLVVRKSESILRKILAVL